MIPILFPVQLAPSGFEAFEMHGLSVGRHYSLPSCYQFSYYPFVLNSFLHSELLFGILPFSCKYRLQKYSYGAYFDSFFASSVFAVISRGIYLGFELCICGYCFFTTLKKASYLPTVIVLASIICFEKSPVRQVLAVLKRIFFFFYVVFLPFLEDVFFLSNSFSCFRFIEFLKSLISVF